MKDGTITGVLLITGGGRGIGAAVALARRHAGASLGRRSSIRLRIFRNSSLGTATSANWNVT